MPGLRLMAELGLDGNGFAAGFRRAKGVTEGATDGIKHFVMGAVGIGAVEEMIRRTVDTAKELVDASERLSIAPEQLQIMREACKQSNVEFEKLAGTFEKIDVARQKALTPGAEGADARRAFGAMGISVSQLRAQSGSQLLMGSMRDQILSRTPQELGAIFRELGVKSIGQLIPVLKTNFDALGEKMKKMGAIMDTETAVKLKHLSDEFSLLGQVITSQLGPILIKFAEWLYGIMLRVGKTTAGAAAFYGAGLAKQGPLQAIGSIFKTAGLGAEHLLGMIDTKTLKERLGKVMDLPAAQTAAQSAEGPWKQAQAQFEAFQKKMKEEADKLDHPTAKVPEGGVLPPKLTKKDLTAPSDSLVRIGNFLGSGQGAMMQINQRKVQLLQQIVNNTKPRQTPQKNTVGDEAPTFFPV